MLPVFAVTAWVLLAAEVPLWLFLLASMFVRFDPGHGDAAVGCHELSLRRTERLARKPAARHGLLVSPTGLLPSGWARRSLIVLIE